MIGVMQTRRTKHGRPWRLTDLMDNLPLSPERYALAREALLNEYRSSRTGFREVPRVLLDWERRGLQPDPRRQWYEGVLGASDMTLLESFHKEHIAGKKKMISLVGESGRLDLDGLKTFGTIRMLDAGDIFVE